MRRVAGRPRQRPDTPDAPQDTQHDVAAAEAAPPEEPAPAAVARPAAAPSGEPDLLVVGRIGKPQGLRGEVTVEVRTDEPDQRFADGSVLLTSSDGRLGTLTVAGTRYQNGRLMVAFEGVPDRTAAERLRGTLLHVDANTLPPPEDPDVFLDVHLVGLRAELEDGTDVGVVAEVLHLPHGDVLAVTRTDAKPGATEVLVPFVAAMVPVVDVAGGRVVLTPPEGLLDLSEPTPDPDEAQDEPDAS